MSTLDKFAEELKEKREALGISINDIYEMTRIDKHYLEEIEKGNFKIMPEVYMRAFIRKYADAVELNPEEIIIKYEAAKSGKVFDEKVMLESEEKTDATEKNKTIIDTNANQNKYSEKNYNPYLIIGFALAVILIGIIYFAFLGSESNEIIREQKVEEILNDRKTAVETPRYEISEKETISETNKKSDLISNKLKIDSLNLKINALDTVWFRTEIDNTERDEFILYPNGTKTLNAKAQINILIGNAAGIEFILNGEKLNMVGNKGEIKNVSIDIEGIHYLKLKNESNND